MDDASRPPPPPRVARREEPPEPAEDALSRFEASSGEFIDLPPGSYLRELRAGRANVVWAAVNLVLTLVLGLVGGAPPPLERQTGDGAAAVEAGEERRGPAVPSEPAAAESGPQEGERPAVPGPIPDLPRRILWGLLPVSGALLVLVSAWQAWVVRDPNSRRYAGCAVATATVALALQAAFEVWT